MADALIPNAKYSDHCVTAKGEPRASVAWSGLKTLWFNTGTLCNITCANCYIDSSPTNDRLVYLTRADVEPYLAELTQTAEIGITGGEPFMAPEIIAILDGALARGHTLLVLTNAMRPMMRPRVQAGLADLAARYPGRMTLRVSLDSHDSAAHDAERGQVPSPKPAPASNGSPPRASPSRSPAARRCMKTNTPPATATAPSSAPSVWPSTPPTPDNSCSSRK